MKLTIKLILNYLVNPDHCSNNPSPGTRHLPRHPAPGTPAPFKTINLPNLNKSSKN